MRKKSKAFESTLAKELDISSHLSSRHDPSSARSDARRTVEDLLEFKRYKALHDDFLD